MNYISNAVCHPADQLREQLTQGQVTRETVFSAIYSKLEQQIEKHVLSCITENG